MTYVALDFETANYHSDSACALGMVKFFRDEIIDEFYTLICPPELVFNARNIEIHGIQPTDVIYSPKFPDISQKIIEFIGDSVVMAHNAGFDLKVLNALICRYNIKFSEFDYYCTWLLSKRLYPQLPSRSLDSLAERINFDFHHHNALEDARACAAVFYQMEKEIAPDSIESVMRKRRFKPDYCMFPYMPL